MIGMFRWISSWFDRRQEKALLTNPELKKSLGALGVIFLAGLLVIAGSLVARIHVAHLPKPKVFLVEKGKAPVLVPTLNTPSLSQIKVQRWTTRTLREIFSFNFVNYQEHMASISDDFTDLGWNAFLAGLKASKVEDRISQDRLDVYLVPINTARMINVQRFNGVVVFHLQMDCLMVYRGATKTETKPMLADVIVRQIPTSDNPDGVAISDLALHQSN